MVQDLKNIAPAFFAFVAIYGGEWVLRNNSPLQIILCICGLWQIIMFNWLSIGQVTLIFEVVRLQFSQELDKQYEKKPKCIKKSKVLHQKVR